MEESKGNGKTRTDIAKISTMIENIEGEIKEIKQCIKDFRADFVTRELYNAEVGLLKKIVYSLVTVIVITVFGAVIKLVLL